MKRSTEMECLRIPEIPDLTHVEKVVDNELFRLPIKVPQIADVGGGGKLLVRTSRTLYFNRSLLS